MKFWKHRSAQLAAPVPRLLDEQPELFPPETLLSKAPPPKAGSNVVAFRGRRAVNHATGPQTPDMLEMFNVIPITGMTLAEAQQRLQVVTDQLGIVQGFDALYQDPSHPGSGSLDNTQAIEAYLEKIEGGLNTINSLRPHLLDLTTEKTALEARLAHLQSQPKAA